jgi:hypothetical protein
MPTKKFYTTSYPPGIFHNYTTSLLQQNYASIIVISASILPIGRSGKSSEDISKVFIIKLDKYNGQKYSA